MGPGANVGAEGGGGFTALDREACWANLEAVPILLAAGANVEAQAGGYTPIQFAMRHDSNMVVELLQEHGAHQPLLARVSYAMCRKLGLSGRG